METAATSTVSDVYTVKTSIFEGPLDLLLDLIEKRKLPISELSLSKVTDDYIAHIKELSEFPVAMSAHFILIASTLLLIKSRSLLPSMALTDEEKGSIEELERRLQMLKRARELSRHIRERFGTRMIFPQDDRVQIPVFSPDKSVTVFFLSEAIRRVLQNMPKPITLTRAVVQKVISLEEMIVNLTRRVQEGMRITFGEFANINKSERVHVIVGFLAMLELVKQGIISVRQEKAFDEIHMETEKLDVPRYA